MSAAREDLRRELGGRLWVKVSRKPLRAAHEFITGPLLTDPHRIGKRLLPPMDDSSALAVVPTG